MTALDFKAVIGVYKLKCLLLAQMRYERETVVISIKSTKLRALFSAICTPQRIHPLDGC